MSADPVVFVTSTLEPSGANRQALSVARALAAAGQRVIWLALGRRGPLGATIARHGAELVIVPWLGRWDVIAAWRLYQVLSAVHPAVLHAWDWASRQFVEAYSLRSGVPQFVATMRGGVADDAKCWRALSSLAAMRGTVVLSCNAARQQAARYARGARLEVIADGVAAAPLAGAAAAGTSSGSSLRQQLGLPADARLIGTVARLVPAANLKDAIWATDLLQVARDDVHLAIAGDGPARANLERFARLCGVGARVHFLGWRLDVPDWLGQLDLLWQPAPRSTPSLAVLEAQAAGVPVVACDSPGHRQTVADGQSGYLVAAGDRANLARCAQRLLENRELAVRLGTAGCERVRREHDQRRMVEAYLGLYRTAPQGAGRAPHKCGG